MTKIFYYNFNIKNNYLNIDLLFQYQNNYVNIELINPISNIGHLYSYLRSPYFDCSFSALVLHYWLINLNLINLFVFPLICSEAVRLVVWIELVIWPHHFVLCHLVWGVRFCLFGLQLPYRDKLLQLCVIRLHDMPTETNY